VIDIRLEDRSAVRGCSPSVVAPGSTPTATCRVTTDRMGGAGV
jgi:hypothetical protein